MGQSLLKRKSNAGYNPFLILIILLSASVLIGCIPHITFHKEFLLFAAGTLTAISSFISVIRKGNDDYTITELCNLWGLLLVCGSICYCCFKLDDLWNTTGSSIAFILIAISPANQLKQTRNFHSVLLMIISLGLLSLAIAAELDHGDMSATIAHIGISIFIITELYFHILKLLKK